MNLFFFAVLHETSLAGGSIVSQCTNLPIASYLKRRTHERATQTVERETLSASGAQTLQVSLEGEVVRSDGLCSVLRNSLTVLNYNAMFGLDSSVSCSGVQLYRARVGQAKQACVTAEHSSRPPVGKRLELSIKYVPLSPGCFGAPVF